MEQIILWDYSVWSFLIQMGIIAVAILVGNTIRRKVAFIRNSLLPTAVIAGFIILVLKAVPFISNIVDSRFMEAVTYHTLALGFICVSLKSGEGKNGKKMTTTKAVTATGTLTVATYLLQAVIGGVITIILAVTLYPDLMPAGGILLPMGFGQGPGQALNFGVIYEGKGFVNGATFGLGIATVGFLFACIGGVIYMNILDKKGVLKRAHVDGEGQLSIEDIAGKNEIPLAESVDKFTLQLGIILTVYLLAYGAMWGISALSIKFLGDFGTNTVQPLMWGFNFIFGTLFAVLAKVLMRKLSNVKLMTRSYSNNFLLSRISGFMFDIMIVAGICAIEVENLKTWIVPFALVCVIGGIVTMVYLRFICKRLYPTYENEAFFGMFGMLTGTASTGMILLRQVDPNFETPMATNIALQSLPAIIWGLPLLFLVPYAGNSLQSAIIVVIAAAGMFALLNFLMMGTGMRDTSLPKE